MARVPTREAFQVLPGGGNAGRARDPGSARLASVQGQSLSHAGEGLQRAGSVASKLVEKEQDRINQARVREAALSLREGMAEAQQEYEQFKGAELVAGDRPIMRDIQAKVDKQRNDLMQGLSSRDAQDAFDAVSSEMTSGWQEKASTYEAAQADFYVEQQRDGMIVAQIETAIQNPKKRAGSLKAASDVLGEKFRDQGFDGDRLDQKSKEAMDALLTEQVKLMLDADDTEGARDMLDASDGLISQDAGTAIGTAIDEKEMTGRVNSTADEIWDDADGEYSTALKMAGMIKDEQDQEAIKKRLNTLKARDNAAEAEATREAVTAAWGSLEEGGSVDRLPSDVWERLGPQTRIQMRAWEKAQANAAAAGTKRVTDLGAYDAFYTELETGSAEAALGFLNSHADQFSESDYRSLRAKVSGAMDDDGATIESARSQGQSIASAMERAGIKDKNRGELLRAYDEEYQKYQAEKGEEPSDQWRDETIEMLAAKVKVRKPGWWNDTTGAVHEFDSVGFIPEERTQAVLAAFAGVDSKTVVRQRAAEEAYTKAMMQFRLGGIENPSDEALTAMIRAHQGGDE